MLNDLKASLPVDLAWNRPHWFTRKYASSAIGALLTLAILLGKEVACLHAPGRAIFFDAMLLVPVSLLAYHQGLVTGLVAGSLAVAFDLLMGAKTAGVLLPAYLSLGGVQTTAVAKLFSVEVTAAMIALATHRSRDKARKAEERSNEYLKRIYMLERHSEALVEDARNQQAQFEESLNKYSSLVYLLEEAAQKIYSNLEAGRLFQALFRVLEECFGSSCASVYLKDRQTGSYLLASTFGAEDQGGDAIPMILHAGDPQTAELERTRRAICWRTARMAARFVELGRPIPCIISGLLVDKSEVVGIVNVHELDGPANPDETLMAMVCNIASIALANARLFGEVQWMAERDPLTKLYNRRSFHDQLEAHVGTRTQSREPFALLMFDIDHFKSFNDTYGHQAGDAVLEWFAAHCEECAGRDAVVSRYGGEEFTVLLPGGDSAAGRKLAEQIRSRIEKATFRYMGSSLKVTLSCGVAVFPVNGADSDELVRKADAALYRAKAAGRNTVVVCESQPGFDSSIVLYQPETRPAGGGETADRGAPAASGTPRSKELERAS